MAHITLTNDGSIRAPYGTVANAIKTLRTKRELSQQKLADKTGVTQSAVASWESGRTCPSVKRAKLLAIVFDVPLELILAHRRTLFA